MAPISANPVSISKKYERSVKLLKLSFRCNFPQISILIFKKVTRVNNNYSLFKKIRKRILLCLPFDACMQPFHDNILMQSGFLLFPISSQSRMSISHTHGHRGPHGGPKMIRYTPRVAVFCFVLLLMQLHTSKASMTSACKLQYNAILWKICYKQPIFVYHTRIPLRGRKKSVRLQHLLSFLPFALPSFLYKYNTH